MSNMKLIFKGTVKALCIEDLEVARELKTAFTFEEGHTYDVITSVNKYGSNNKLFDKTFVTHIVYADSNEHICLEPKDFGKYFVVIGGIE